LGTKDLQNGSLQNLEAQGVIGKIFRTKDLEAGYGLQVTGFRNLRIILRTGNPTNTASKFQIPAKSRVKAFMLSKSSKRQAASY
jgi:hypothetical protein